MPDFKPRDPDFENRIKTVFASQTAMASMHINLIAVLPGHIKMTLDKTPQLLQQQGFIHGGVISSALDSACGFAALSLSAPATEVLSIEFKTSFLLPASTDRLYIEGEVLKSGRRVSFCQSKAYDSTGEDRKLVAMMTSSLAHVDMPADWIAGTSVR